MHRNALLILLLLVIAPHVSTAHRMHHNMSMMGAKKLPESQRRAGNPVPADEASLKRGAAIFKTYCATCHGERGKGDGPASPGLAAKPANLQMLAGRVPDQRFAAHISQGGQLMPPFKDLLKINQIWDVTNFVQTLVR